MWDVSNHYEKKCYYIYETELDQGLGEFYQRETKKDK